MAAAGAQQTRKAFVPADIGSGSRPVCPGTPSVTYKGPCCATFWCDGSANRPGGPIAAGKRPHLYIGNDPALQARIKMAHRPLVEVDDAARP